MPHGILYSNPHGRLDFLLHFHGCLFKDVLCHLRACVTVKRTFTSAYMHEKFAKTLQLTMANGRMLVTNQVK